jgi:DNA-nicking Smr family endonuclease
MKSFDELATLRASLQAQALEQARRDREARERRARLEREHPTSSARRCGGRPFCHLGSGRPARTRLLPVAQQRELDEAATLTASLSDEIDVERFLDVDDEMSWRRTGIGPEVVRKLRRGHWAIKAQTDLHGLRTDEAREALVGFLVQARASGVALRAHHPRQGPGLRQSRAGSQGQGAQVAGPARGCAGLLPGTAQSMVARVP